MYNENGQYPQHTPPESGKKDGNAMLKGVILGALVAVALMGIGISAFFAIGTFSGVHDDAKIEMIIEAEPQITWLADMEWFAANPNAHRNGWLRGGSWLSSMMDNEGNTYENGGIFAGTTNVNRDNNHSITYLLDNQFSRFTGSIVLAHSSRDATRNYRIEFYGDGILIHESMRITGGTRPIHFDIDVSGISELRINRIAGGTAEIGIVNAGFRHR
ncbi:MAG: NPCBM/NEW2 domain-containing protein [Defluviitaleaceae bacterium]|nr:NPCBM/NEW2 domain-containing protein [Defluviitaleaceae bacterium]